MNDTEVKELVELLLPYIKKEIKNDNDFKTNEKRKNATVVSVTKDSNDSTLGQSVQV